MLGSGGPTKEMISLATELGEFAELHGDQLLSLIYAHYKYAEANEWLDFWDVQSGLEKSEILSHVDSISLVVSSDMAASVFVNPSWDPEHKIDMRYSGSISAINEQPFELVNGTLAFR